MQKIKSIGTTTVVVTFVFVVLGLAFLGFRNGASLSVDPRAPAVGRGRDTAIIFNSGVATSDFDYNTDRGILTVQVVAYPPYIMGNWVGGSSLQRMARQEFERQIAAFEVQNPGIRVTQQGSPTTTLETNWLRSAEDGNRITVMTFTCTVQPK